MIASMLESVALRYVFKFVQVTSPRAEGVACYLHGLVQTVEETIP